MFMVHLITLLKYRLCVTPLRVFLASGGGKGSILTRMLCREGQEAGQVYIDPK